jgi:hypothetical protein
VALIERHTDDRIACRASAQLARVRLRARIAVITRGTIRFVRIGAHARCWIAKAHVMTLIHGRARNEVCPRATARLARIRLRAGIVVIAGRSIRFIGMAARACGRIARTRKVALIQGHARDGTRANASARLARIGLGTTIAVVARCSIDDIREDAGTRGHVAAIGRTRIVVVARHAAAQGTP